MTLVAIFAILLAIRCWRRSYRLARCRRRHHLWIPIYGGSIGGWTCPKCKLHAYSFWT